jgi:hypothetical protein
MPDTTPEEGQTHEAFEELKRLRDQARLKVHLAGLEARSQWEALEERFLELEQAVRSQSAGSQTLARIRELTEKVAGLIKH